MSQQLASIEKQITETAARRKISYDARVTQICCGPTENGCDAIIGKPGAMVSARKFQGSLQQVLNLMPVKSG